MPHPALEQQNHRPWPIPSRPWIMQQVWHDLAFLHWPVPAAALRPFIPGALEVDQFNGSAWVAVTPFWMSGVTVRGLPALPGLSRFTELNVRTYVTRDQRPGVWFFSLDADSPLAVRGARLMYHLPYHDAAMKSEREGNLIRYSSERPSGARFVATYQPTGPVALSRPGSLEHWLTERYCLYAQSKAGKLYRGEIHHAPWPLQPARAEIEHSDMLQANGIAVAGPPADVRWSERLEVVIWPLERLSVTGADE